MSSRDHYEARWRSLPAGLEPPDFEVRRRFLLEHLSAGERVLDVGCGDGSFAAELQAAGAEVVGIDVADEALRRARARNPEIELQMVDQDRPWPLEDASFDVVWAGEVIEHVADTAAWLSEVRRVLRSGGALLLSTPDHGPLTLLAAGLSKRAFATRFDPLGEHLRYYNSATLSLLIEEFGFQGVQIRAHGGIPGARRVLLAHAIRSRF
ncbi:MAG TPA: methyltransferase domain-containing protein [Solirubrobacteraceae bacterium]|jgi:2-polyprenyl-3-methyl-5-hydroxy-6-metoxy-1,4-benzoquinol methylase|nr:methyltransferase domain-containing protein [Solirubrobacteraceae bacterium]